MLVENYVFSIFNLFLLYLLHCYSFQVVYFTATFPYLILIIFFGYGLTLDGSSEGIMYYLTPTYDKLLDIHVWSDAATQIFYSLGIAFGNLSTLSSYSKFDNDCHRDALLVASVNCLTSFFAGFPVFAILGFMAKQSGQDIEDVVQSGVALVFVAFPEACTYMPAPQLWSFLFFAMLFTLGVGSMIGYVATLVSVLCDEYDLTKHKHYVTIAVCFIMFVGGLTMCFSSGLYMFDLLDNVSATWNIMLFALIEVVIVSWFYGVDKFMKDIEKMDIKIPKVLAYYWSFCWCFLTPALILFIIIMQFIEFEVYSYGDYVYPLGIQVMARLIPLSSVLPILVIGVYTFCNYRKRGLSFSSMFNPLEIWRPQIYE